jgi:hypothetical protein
MIAWVVMFSSDPRRATPSGPPFAQFWCNVTPLDATLTRPPVSVDSKPLTENLSPLDATLTKNTGEGGVMVNGTDRADG